MKASKKEGNIDIIIMVMMDMMVIMGMMVMMVMIIIVVMMVIMVMMVTMVMMVMIIMMVFKVIKPTGLLRLCRSCFFFGTIGFSSKWEQGKGNRLNPFIF